MLQLKITKDINDSSHFTYLHNENQQPPGSDWYCESNIRVIWSNDDKQTEFSHPGNQTVVLLTADNWPPGHYKKIINH